jgi:hypothetical protein
VEECYRFCLDAYARNAGGYDKMFEPSLQCRHPFEPSIPSGHSVGDRQFFGAFGQTAVRFGIDELLERWIGDVGALGIRTLSKYLSLISKAGLAYVLNFGLMRISEGMGLRAGCYEVERGPLEDEIHLLAGAPTITGATSKTLEQDNAQWIVSPSCSLAIEAMTSVAKLRLEAAKNKPGLTLSRDELQFPLLAARPHEPWTPLSPTTTGVRKRERAYCEFIQDFPLLFEKEELRITDNDLSVARQMTFGLDPDAFAVGKVWPLSWHQLRRTGACNMLASGHVSESSLQYQMKHLNRAMTRYYGQGHYKLAARLDDDARSFYVREMYESFGRELRGLQDERFISPHGVKRKLQILDAISDKDHLKLAKEAARGRVGYRETFFGGCTRPEADCPYGGVSNVAMCMGFGAANACGWVLVDRTKKHGIEKLLASFRTRYEAADPGSPLATSLLASMESAERALQAIELN